MAFTLKIGLCLYNIVINYLLHPFFMLFFHLSKIIFLKWEHYQSFIGKESTKSLKQSKAITQQPNTFENPDIVDIKSVTIGHPKHLHKLSKTIRQAEKVS